MITVPSDCTDAFWMYQVELPAGFPDNIDISVDSEQAEIFIKQSHSETLGFQNGYTSSGQFNVVVNGLLDTTLIRK